MICRHRQPEGTDGNLDQAQDFQRRKDFLALTAEDERALQELHAVLAPEVPGCVERFYSHLLSFPEIQALIRDEATLARLKRQQERYFRTLTAGSYGQDYRSDRQRVGLAHARIGLSPGWYLGAYGHYLLELLPKVAEVAGEHAQAHLAAYRAFIKVVLLDMGLAIDSYIAHRDELIADLRDYGAAFAKLPYGTLVATADLQVVFANRAFETLFGFAPDSLRGASLGRLMDVSGLQALVRNALDRHDARGSAQLRPLAAQLAIPVHITAHCLPRAPGLQEQRLLLVFEDLREQTQLARDLLNAQAVASIGTWQTDFDDSATLTPQAARILGWPVGKPLHYADVLGCVHPEDRVRADAQWREGLASGHFAVEVRVQDGAETRWVDARGKIEHNALSTPVRGYGTVLDITERKRAEQRMERLAFFDTLTGLPNRIHGMELAQRLLDGADRRGLQAVVLFADLDRFKEINDTQGHAVGDLVLTAVSQHCRHALGEDGVLARLGGDEFMFARVLAPGDDALALAHRLRDALACPVSVGNLRFEVNASIGLAVHPADGRGVDELLQRADIAMYRAKMQGVGCLRYDEAMGQALQRRIALGARLEEALAQSRLALHFQPKVSLATGELCGVEALARWHDPAWGWVPPGEFVPIAEERGLIAALGDWSLDAAARQWSAWRSAGVAHPPSIAVNVCAAQVMDETFPERALALVSTHGVSPRAIELEITESALMHDPGKARRVASRLVEQGFALSIDDFGTGYSSLARLQSFPVSRLKIDMSFVRTMLTDPGSLAIVGAVIGMARALRLRTVAEGVEACDQVQKLRELQCDEAQGYLYARALPADELERHWLRR